MEQIEAMLDCIVDNEKEPDVMQISGGEETGIQMSFASSNSARRGPSSD